MLTQENKVGDAHEDGGGLPTVVFLDFSIMVGHDLLVDTLAFVGFLRRWLAPCLRLVVVKSPALALHSGLWSCAAQVAQHAPAREAWYVRDCRDCAIAMIV